jgi:antitoxin (DNA-binding transcriptional repressor) of toxin-antitoxin stability system
MDATIVDLRYRMKNVLQAIDRGEAVTVLYRGKPKATLVPISPALRASGKDAPKMADQPLFGLWKDRDDLSDPASYVRNLREPRALAGGKGK